MYYLDSNVFIEAFFNTSPLGEKARSILDQVVKGHIEACTSYLTFDEVFWELKRRVPRSEALSLIKIFLQTPWLLFIPVDNRVAHQSYDLLLLYDIGPRDSIHAASALVSGATSIISQDPDFSMIQGLQWKKIL